MCRGVGWGVEGKQVGSMDEDPQVRGCYNITFICTPTNQETVTSGVTVCRWRCRDLVATAYSLNKPGKGTPGSPQAIM